MSRKDYIEVAALLDAARRDVEGVSTSTPGIPGKDLIRSAYQDGAKAIVRRIAVDMAQVFRADNARFDRARFMEACGFPENS